MANSSVIIAEIVKCGKYLEICKNITRNNELCNDLFQECILILLEKPAEKIIELYNKDELRPYFIRIVQNNYNSKQSPFFKKYKQRIEFIKDQGEEIESNYDYDKIIDHLKDGTGNRAEWFDNQIVNALVIDNNIRKLSRRTGINREYISASIERFKEKINGNENFKRKSI